MYSTYYVDRSWLDDYGVKWIQYVAGLMDNYRSGYVLVFGEGLADRRGDLKLFDRSTILRYVGQKSSKCEYVLDKCVFIRQSIST